MANDVIDEKSTEHPTSTSASSDLPALRFWLPIEPGAWSSIFCYPYPTGRDVKRCQLIFPLAEGFFINLSICAIH